MFKNKKEITISNIKYFHFSYSVGYAMNAYVIYELNYKDDKYIISIKPNGISDEEKKEVEVDNSFIQKLEEILKKYHVEKWNGFNKHDKNVLDGDSVSLNIRMENNDYLSASGYMKWPNNYGNVRGELDTIFMNIYNQNKL